MKTLYLYQDKGDNAVKRFLQSFPSKQQERLLRQIAMLLLPQLGKPPVKHFRWTDTAPYLSCGTNIKPPLPALFSHTMPPAM